jgi:hypothetical protein
LNRKEMDMIANLRLQVSLNTAKTQHVDRVRRRKLRSLHTDHEEQEIYNKRINISDTMHKQNMHHFRRALAAQTTHPSAVPLRKFATEFKTRRTHERFHDMLVYDIPWSDLIPNMRSLMEADMHRMNWWAEGAHGEPPPEADSTVHSLLGVHIPPSEIGRALRRLGHEIVHDKAPPWEVNGKLAQSMASHRSVLHENVRDDEEMIWWPTHALLDGRNRTGAIRRLGEEVAFSFGKSIFGNTLRTPVVRSAPLDRSWAEFFDDVITYAIYNVFLCYLHKPNIDGTNLGTLGDGSAVQGHRTGHMCFPGIPFALPQMPTYEEFFHIDPRTYLKDHPQPDDYDDWCPDGSIVKWVRTTANSLTRAIGYDLDTPQGRAIASSMVYPVWAFSSLDSIIRSFADKTATNRLQHAVCGLAHVGSIAYMIAFFSLLSSFYLCMCWPCINIISQCIDCFCCGTLKCCRGRKRRKRRRYDSL